MVGKGRSQRSISRVIGDRGFLNSLTLLDLHVSLTHVGCSLCSFCVPRTSPSIQGHVVVDAQFKFILKKILENLRLSATSNECENMV